MYLTDEELRFLQILADGDTKTYVHVVRGFGQPLTPMAPTFTNRIESSSGRVDLGGCPPRSPTDPGLHITRTRFLTYDFAALRNRLWTTRGLGKP